MITSLNKTIEKEQITTTNYTQKHKTKHKHIIEYRALKVNTLLQEHKSSNKMSFNKAKIA